MTRHPDTACIAQSLLVCALRGRPVALAVASLLSVTGVSAQTLHTFAIPPGPLSTVLSGAAVQAGVMLSADAALTQGIDSQGVQGRFTAEDALARAVRGTGLAVVPAPNGGFTLRAVPAISDPANHPGTGRGLAPVTVSEKRVDTTKPPVVYAGGQVASGARLGLLGDTDVMDAPVSFVSFTQQTMQNQQARSLADVLVNDPSVRAVNAHGGFYDDFAIRGFNVRGSELALNGLFGLAPSRRVATEILERVEVVKGPSALLTGMSPGGAIGGSVNIVPKRADAAPLTQITTTYQSDSQLGAHLDVGRRWGEQSEWGLRFNGAYRSGDTAVDKQHAQSGLAGLALDYTGKQLRATLDVISQREKIQRPRAILDFGSGVNPLPSPPESKTNYLPAGYSIQEDATVVGRVEYDFLNGITAFAALGSRQSDFDAINGNPGNGDYLGVNGAGDFTVRQFNFLTRSRTVSGETGLRGEVRTGAIRHRWVTSVSALESKGDTGNQVSAGIVSSNIYHPQTPPSPPQYPDSLRKNSFSRLKSVAVANTMSAWDDRILLTLGLRHQSVESKNYSYSTGATTTSYASSANSPMVGLVFKPASNIALYANHLSGLSQGGTAPNSASNAGEVFAPYKTKQHEVGAKWDRGDFAATLSFFSIQKPNSMTDPVSRRYSFDGEQRNQGVELSLFGEVLPRVRMMGGAAWTKGKITKAAGGINQGNTAAGVPRQQYNINTEWDVPALENITLTARATYTGSQFLSANNTQFIPSWTRYDVGVRHATRVAGKDVVVRLNIENVLNKNYWIGYGNGYVSLSVPRTVLLSTSIAF